MPIVPCEKRGQRSEQLDAVPVLMKALKEKDTPDPGMIALTLNILGPESEQTG
jgi:hypothetical protein